MLNSNSGIIIALATLALVLITAYYSWLVKKTLEHTQKDRKIKFISKKLEKLCYPFLFAIKTCREDFFFIDKEIAKLNDDKRMTGDVCQDPEAFKIWQIIIEKYFYFRQDLEKIIAFLGLDPKIEELFYRSMEGINDALYLKDFKYWKILDEQQKCKEINEIKMQVDFSNLHYKLRTNLDSIIPQILLDIIRPLRDERERLIKE